MTILAIDPGTQRLGWAHGDPIRCGVLAVRDASLWQVAEHVRGLISDARATELVIEVPGPWMRSRKADKSFEAVTKLYEVIGAIAASTPNRVALVSDSDVKMAIAGHRSARKHEVHGVVLLAGVDVPQLARQTCADCRAAGGAADHSPDAADAAALAMYARLYAPAHKPLVPGPTAAVRRR